MEIDKTTQENNIEGKKGQSYWAWQHRDVIRTDPWISKIESQIQQVEKEMGGKHVKTSVDNPFEKRMILTSLEEIFY